jgi:hypothetical protein
MGGKHHRAVIRAFVQFIYKDRAQTLKVLNYMAIMDNFVAHINGGAKLLDGLFNNLYGPVHTGAKPSRRSQ